MSVYLKSFSILSWFYPGCIQSFGKLQLSMIYPSMDKLEIQFRLKDIDRTLGFQNEISLGISYSLDPAKFWRILAESLKLGKLKDVFFDWNQTWFFLVAIAGKGQLKLIKECKIILRIKNAGNTYSLIKYFKSCMYHTL